MTQYSLVSANIHTALSSWASGSPSFLRQAGVAVAQTPLKASSTKNTKTNAYSMLPNGAAAVVNVLQSQVVHPTQSVDFKFVTKYALDHTPTEQDEDGNVVHHRADLSAFFAQVATLVDDDGAEDKTLQEDDAEAAELQLELMSGLSPEALAVLTDAYKQCQTVLQASSRPTSTVHFLLTCAARNKSDAEPTSAGSAAGGDKRRLSKAERKKMKIAPAEVRSVAQKCAVPRSEVRADATSNSNCAVLMLQCQYNKRENSYKVTLLTAEDVCRSYYDALNGV